MEGKKQVIQQFGKNAENYVTSHIHAKGEDLQKLTEIIRACNPSGELLDIATGGGHVANALSPYFQQVVALDLTPEMIEKAKDFLRSNGVKNVAFVQGDAENLPFPDESIGTITCRIAAHHFSNVEQFVRDVYRVLKSNGLFILIDNVTPENDGYDHFYNLVERQRDPSHVRAYKKSEWLTKLETSGFFIEELHTFRKKFVFNKWCDMMGVTQDRRQELSKMFLSSSLEQQKYFSIVHDHQSVESFQGQSMLVVARKG
ncbi:class I SAM-dependent methyltransferase [Mesobacillus maritimus]|uniref:class I SAM-dependent methyltransferase n=1 Tax=Mesobacillus maritimus TaxID=1643336 RepID=UPI00203F939C|nr:class I SAM-dependent methyltransferase [Mesobacillus maritimus]MCM3584318.1 class I SAM-dependent methyltransferase [Mesobacillus maritimus]MCM3669265.1 class I SAM-dependent methyltransferase [Mesobacillus maritimus]